MTWHQLINTVLDPSMHWFVAFSAGVLVYSLTSITSFVLLQIMEKTGRVISWRVAVIGIVLIPLLLALSAGVASHCLLDGLFSWYVTPLGPPLKQGLDILHHN